MPPTVTYMPVLNQIDLCIKFNKQYMVELDCGADLNLIF